MYQIGSLVEMKKPHACVIKETGKKSNQWKVLRVGAVSYTHLFFFISLSLREYLLKFHMKL